MCLGGWAALVAASQFNVGVYFSRKRYIPFLASNRTDCCNFGMELVGGCNNHGFPSGAANGVYQVLRSSASLAFFTFAKWCRSESSAWIYVLNFVPAKWIQKYEVRFFKWKMCGYHMGHPYCAEAGAVCLFKGARVFEFAIFYKHLVIPWSILFQKNFSKGSTNLTEIPQQNISITFLRKCM